MIVINVLLRLFRNKNVFNFNKTYKYVRPVRQTSSQSQVKPWARGADILGGAVDSKLSGVKGQGHVHTYSMYWTKINRPSCIIVSDHF